MFAAANQPHFTLSIQGKTHDFKVLEFTGHEALSQTYRFELDLISEQPDLDIESYLHQPAFLAFAANGKGVHGIIHSIAQNEVGRRLTRYRITLVPQLAYLAHRTNQRIFQQSGPWLDEAGNSTDSPEFVKQHLEINHSNHRDSLKSDWSRWRETKEGLHFFLFLSSVFFYPMNALWDFTRDVSIKRSCHNWPTVVLERLKAEGPTTRLIDIEAEPNQAQPSSTSDAA